MNYNWCFCSYRAYRKKSEFNTRADRKLKQMFALECTTFLN